MPRVSQHQQLLRQEEESLPPRLPSPLHHFGDEDAINNEIAQQPRSRPLLLQVPPAADEYNNPQGKNYYYNRLESLPATAEAKRMLFYPFLLACTLGCLLWGHALYRQRHDNAAFPSFLTADDYRAANFGNTVANDDGAACFTALDCGPGRWCAFPSMHNMSIRTCCDEAVRLVSAFAEDNPVDNAWLTVCTGAAVGEPCGSHHALCTSGFCVHGHCAAQGLPTGQKCPNHGACASGACGRHAHHTNTTTATQQRCCPTADYTMVETSNVPYPVHYCHGTAKHGEPCGTHSAICQQGLTCGHNQVCQQ